MLPKTHLRTACGFLAVVVSSSGFAGWQGRAPVVPSHGVILRPVAANSRIGPRPGQALPPFAGIIHERAGRSPTLTTFGHTDTSVTMPARGYVLRGYGPAVGAPRDRRIREAYGRGFRPYPVYGFGRRRYDYGPTGTIDSSGAAFPAIITAPDTGGFIAPGQGYSYAEPPLDSIYAEPSLAQAYGGGYGYAPMPLPSSAPQVIVVNNVVAPQPGRACTCRPAAATNPVVYRYGVGTAY